jgi:hypothetical protein
MMPTAVMFSFSSSFLSILLRGTLANAQSVRSTKWSQPQGGSHCSKIPVVLFNK